MSQKNIFPKIIMVLWIIFASLSLAVEGSEVDKVVNIHRFENQVKNGDWSPAIVLKWFRKLFRS